MYLLVFVAAVVNIEKSHSAWQVLLPGRGKTQREHNDHSAHGQQTALKIKRLTVSCSLHNIAQVTVKDVQNL